MLESVTEESEEDSGSRATKESLARKWLRNVWSGSRTRRCAGQRSTGSRSQISCTFIRHSLCTMHRVQGYESIRNDSAFQRLMA